MNVTIDLSVKQVAGIINEMSKAEIETLLIEMNPELHKELKNRLANLDREIEEGKTLSTEEVFDV